MGSGSVVERRRRELFFKVLNLSGFWFLGMSAVYFSDALLTVWFPVQIVLAWLVADLFSGFFHWFIESVLSRFSSFDWLVTPFLEHHAESMLEDETYIPTAYSPSMLLSTYISPIF